jgi:DNA excision repair protein ERCC-1
MTLLSNFGSLASILKASKEELALCPGFGPLKAARLHSALRQPFMKLTT